jgi:nitroreductase
METEHCIKTRRSIRDFKKDKIGHEELAKIIATASFAPSWKNVQATRFIAVEEETLKADLAAECFKDWPNNGLIVLDCPLLMVVTVIRGRSGFNRDGTYTTAKEDRWEAFDAGIATQTLCLAAHDAGIGTVILGIFNDALVQKIVGVPEEQYVAALVAMGYPKLEPAMPKRKTAEELLTYR